MRSNLGSDREDGERERGRECTVKCNRALIARCRSLLPLGGHPTCISNAYHGVASRMHARPCLCFEGKLRRRRLLPRFPGPPPPTHPPLVPLPRAPSRQATKESIDCVTEAQARTNNAAVVPPRPLGRTIEARSAAPTPDPDRDPAALPRPRAIAQRERERERERDALPLAFLLGFDVRGPSRFHASSARPFPPPHLEHSHLGASILILLISALLIS